MSLLPRCARHGVLLDGEGCEDCAALRSLPDHLVPGPPPFEARDDCSCSACAKVRGERAAKAGVEKALIDLKEEFNRHSNQTYGQTAPGEAQTVVWPESIKWMPK